MDNLVFIERERQEGSKFGLSRTRELLNLLSSPDEKLKIIHIAGTNGKGSTAEYITRILVAAGKRVGTFTSPEVYSFTENYKLNGRLLSRAKINFYLEKAVRAAQNMADKPSSFEKETAAALLAFYEEGAEYAVIECGLGGLEDATNAVDKKCVAVITSIGLEHTAVLGGDIKSICRHKAGIIKNCPAVVSALQPPEAEEYFHFNTNAVFAGKGLEILKSDLSGQTFLYNGDKYRIKMHGAAQCYNACCAVEVAKILGIDNGAVKAGLSKAKLFGRVEILKRDKTYILDGSHNPASFAPLMQLLNENYNGVKHTLIYSCLSDKDIKGCIQSLKGAADNVICVASASFRAMDIQNIYSACKGAFDNVCICESMAEALDRADGQVVIICGSFTILKEAKKWIDKRR